MHQILIEPDGGNTRFLLSGPGRTGLGHLGLQTHEKTKLTADAMVTAISAHETLINKNNMINDKKILTVISFGVFLISVENNNSERRLG
jgi:hypothetical protein